MKRFTSLILVVCLVLSIGLVPCYAADEEYKTFMQGDDRWGSTVYGGGATIAYSGCMITSIAVLKAYADPKLRDINKFTPATCATQIAMQGSACAWTSLTSDWKLISSGEHTYSEEETIKAIKAHADKGHYVLIGCASHGMPDDSDHYSPVVGLDSSGTPVLWDVGWGGNKWKEFMNVAFTHRDRFVQIVSYESTVNPSNKTMFGSSISGDDSELTDEQKEKMQENYENIVAEWDLKGLPQEMAFKDGQTHIDLTGRDDLSFAEQRKIAELQESNIGLSPVRVVNIMLIVAGILMLLYSTLLVLSMFFDKVNNLFDFQLVTFMTLGRVTLVNTVDSKEDDEGKKNGLVSVRTFTTGIIIVFVMGLLLVSGVFTKLLYFIGLW